MDKDNPELLLRLVAANESVAIKHVTARPRTQSVQDKFGDKSANNEKDILPTKQGSVIQEVDGYNQKKMPTTRQSEGEVTDFADTGHKLLPTHAVKAKRKAAVKTEQIAAQNAPIFGKHVSKLAVEAEIEDADLSDQKAELSGLEAKTEKSRRNSIERFVVRGSPIGGKGNKRSRKENGEQEPSQSAEQFEKGSQAAEKIKRGFEQSSSIAEKKIIRSKVVSTLSTAGNATKNAAPLVNYTLSSQSTESVIDDKTQNDPETEEDDCSFDIDLPGSHLGLSRPPNSSNDNKPSPTVTAESPLKNYPAAHTVDDADTSGELNAQLSVTDNMDEDGVIDVGGVDDRLSPFEINISASGDVDADEVVEDEEMEVPDSQPMEITSPCKAEIAQENTNCPNGDSPVSPSTSAERLSGRRPKKLDHAVWDPKEFCLHIPGDTDDRWERGGEFFKKAQNKERYARLSKTAYWEFPSFPSLKPEDLVEDRDFVFCETHGFFSPIPKTIEDPPLQFGNNDFIRLPHSSIWRSKSPWKDPKDECAFEKVALKMSMLLTHNYDMDTVQEVFGDLSLSGFESRLSGLRKLWNQCEINGRLDWLTYGISQAATLVMHASQVLTTGIPYLVGPVRSITLSSEQCACLLAMAFFGLFPSRENCQTFSFKQLLIGTSQLSLEKLKFIINFFFLERKGSSAREPTFRSGCVTFYRRSASKEDLPDWSASEVLLERSLLAFEQELSIENANNMMHVDFANKYIGGGVLRQGALQEEIRLLICPEALVALLLCPVMGDHEAITIVGAAQYSNYEGYGDSLRFKAIPIVEMENLPMRDKYGRRNVDLVAIDALELDRSRAYIQYAEGKVSRELDKAYVGFFNPRPDEKAKPIATGNWGCGAFGGDPVLKGLIQWMACAQANRDMLHHTWGDEALYWKLNCLAIALQKHKVTVGALYSLIVDHGSLPLDQREKELWTHIMRHIEEAEAALSTSTPA